MEGRGDSRQVRNSTGPPGVGGGYERAYPWDWNNTGISTPEERWGLRQTKTARAAQEPKGAGQAHAQVAALLFQALHPPPSEHLNSGERTCPDGLPMCGVCVCVCVCVCFHTCVYMCIGGCGRLRVRVGWQVPHCLRHFAPIVQSAGSPGPPAPRPLAHSPWLPGASMSTHPSLPTCSPEPRALRSALSLPALPSPTLRGLPPPSLSSLRSGRWQRREEEGSSPKCRPTEHSSPGGWEVAQAKVPELEKRRGGRGPRGTGAAGLKSFKGKRRSTNHPLPQGLDEVPLI